MVRVLHLIVSVHLGGSEVVAFNLAEHCSLQEPDNIESIIAELHKTTTNYATEKKKEISSKKIRLITLSGSYKRVSLLIAPFTLLYYVRKLKPDIIHSHTDLPDFVLSITLRMLSFFGIKAPKIVRTIHNTHLWPTHDSMGKFAESAFENDIVVGVSHAALQGYKSLRLKNKLSLSANQSVILNGCVIPSKKDHPFKIDKEKINIAFCGRFEHQKGIDVLIDRIKKIKKEYSDHLFFHIAGSGTYLSELQALATSSNNVVLYDSVPNIAEKMHSFDFLVMPSRFEGFGLVSVEASFAKIPVIAAITPGLRETFPPDWPLLFQLEKEEEFLAIIEKIVRKEFDKNELGQQSYRYVSEHFSHEKMIEDYSKLYKQAVKQDK